MTFARSSGMTKPAKRPVASGRRSPIPRGSAAMPPKPVEAYLLAREILRRIRRTSLLFDDLPGTALGPPHPLH
jgi:hypothetical protein